MTKRTYDAITKASLFALAACAILFDRLPQVNWLFGILAIGCALLSGAAYLIYNHGRRAAQETIMPVEAQKAPADRARDGIEVANVSAGSNLRHHLQETLSEAHKSYYIDDSSYVFQKEHVLNLTSVMNYVAVMPRRSFAEEVLSIVRGLSSGSDTPMFEFEFRADGILKVVPCQQKRRMIDELEEELESPKLADNRSIVH
jgi:hypothetical protein